MVRVRLGHVRHALVLAPHADDEVIGAAGLIATLRRRAVRVTVAILTDGAASHPGSRLWPRTRLVAARRREARRALGRLGVAAAAVRFLDLPDGGLPQVQRRCDRAVRRTIARVRADVLVLPACDDAHPDHRAVAAAAARAPGGQRRLSYRVWPPQRRAAARARMVPVPGGRGAKCSLIRQYRTQMGAIRDDPAGFAIARHELAVFAHPVERFVEIRR